MTEKFLQGTIIRGANWPEPVEIKLLEEAGSKHIEMVED